MAPPAFVLGPLIGLLLLARPSTAREWVWLVGSAAWTAVWLIEPAPGVAAQLVRAAAVLLAGAFLALTVYRPSASVSRALVAVTVAGIALAAWAAHLGVPWAEVRHGFERDLWASNRAFVRQIEAAGDARAAAVLLDQLGAAARMTAALLPALLGLAGVAGLRLAWSWHHRIARRPLGTPPLGFAAFRFSDQLVWGLVAGLGVTLLPAPGPGRLAAANLLFAIAVLYAVRGLAVFSAGSRRVSGAAVALLTLVAMFLLPFVVGGLTVLGLADTWLDFRRRGATPVT